jgi:hypothetical protein
MRTNYTEWSLVMKVNLQVAGLWDVIKSDASEYHEDRSALAALLRAVPTEMQVGLVVKATAHDAWEVIRRMWLGADRVKEANAEHLRQEFNDIEFKAGELIEDFSLRLNTVAGQLRALGDDVTDKEVIKRLLHIIPDRLEQVVISMETLLDLNSLSIEEAVGHLHVVEQRKKPPQAKENGGRLLLTKEEWMARMKARDGSSSNSRGKNVNGNYGGKSGAKNRGEQSECGRRMKRRSKP